MGGGKCGKAPEFLRDGTGPPNGEVLSAGPLPVLSTTGALAAHDHFQRLGQRRARGEPGRGAHISSRLSTQPGGTGPARPRTPRATLTSWQQPISPHQVRAQEDQLQMTMPQLLLTPQIPAEYLLWTRHYGVKKENTDQVSAPRPNSHSKESKAQEKEITHPRSHR